MRILTRQGALRLSAVVCLGGSYLFAVTGFDLVWLAVTAAAALAVASGPSYWTGSLVAPPALAWPERRQLWRQLVPGWVLMAASGGWKALHLPAPTLLTWLAGCTWLLVATWSMARSPALQQSRPRVWICGVLVLTFAAALRLWAIDTVPRYVHCDEGTSVLVAQNLFALSPLDLFGAVDAGSYTMHNLTYVIAGAGALLGGFNLVAARMPDIILGILSIALMFDALRRTTNLAVATVATLLLAANHTHLAFSRIASMYIQTAFVVSIIFAVLSRVWTAPTYFNAALLGIVVALGVQTYRASMLTLPLVVAIVALLLVLHPLYRRPLRVPLIVAAITWATASVPAGVTVGQQREALFGRAQELNIFSPHKMAQLKHDVYHTDSAVMVVGHQAWNSLLGFQFGHDDQPQYGSALPMADVYTAALMVPGSVLALLGLRQFVATNALAFTVGYLLFGLGMQWAPGFNRATGALPFGMVLPAIALVQCWGTLWAGRARWLRAARTVCLAAATIWCVAANLHIYFVDYPYSLTRGDEPSEAGWVARKYAAQYTIHLVNWVRPGHEGLRLIVGGLPITFRADSPTVDYVRQVELTGSDLFIISGADTNARDALLARFPDARPETWYPDSTHGPVLFLIFVGPPRSAQTTW